MSGRSGVMTFRELIDREYLQKGRSKIQAWTVIYTQCGVCFHSSRAAFNGTRVQADTAILLRDWAARTHSVWLEALDMAKAPPVPKKKKKRVA